jgi:polysaccharide export outer membrane protein
VGKPGFYSVAPDSPLTDVLMTAGGPSASADFARSQVLRGTTLLADSKRFQQALTGNSTLDDVGMQTGDQIVIGEKPKRWERFVSLVGVLALAATSVVLFAARSHR